MFSDNKEKLVYSFLSFLWVALNVAYFCLYYQSLGLKISFLTLILTSALIISFFLLFILFESKLIRGLVTALYLAMHIYGLINFAFYTVFKTFLILNAGQTNNLNKSFLGLLTDFTNLIPFYFYLGVAFLLASTIHIFFIRRDNFRAIYHLHEAANFIRGKKIISLRRLAVIALILFAINYSSIFLVENYKNVFSSSTASRQDYLANLGIYGYFLLKVTAKEDSPIITTKKAETDLEKLHNDLNSLMPLSGEDTAKTTELSASSTTHLPHVIIYQMESVDNWAVKQNPSPMPFLRKLMENKISAKHFFSNSCMTINAEFATLCSFYPDSFGPISDLYSHNNYNCLPKILHENLGYETSVYHANDSEFWSRNTLDPRWGFENLYFTPYLRERESDNLVLHRVVEKIKDSNKPTFNLVIGFTSHAPHDKGYADLNKMQNNLTITQYTSPLDQNILNSIEIKEDTVRWYMGYLHAIDDGLKNLFLELRDNGLLSNTIVVMYGDHRYYNFKSNDATADFYNYNEIPFAIYVPGQNVLQRDIASQADIAPTVLHLITGNDTLTAANFLGQDILSPKYANFAINKCLGETLLVNNKQVIKNDLLLDTYSNINFTDNTTTDFTVEKNLLHDIALTSDKLLKNNDLYVAGTNNFVATTTTETASSTTDKFTDIDGDGLSDLRERIIGTDQENRDTDGDGVFDGDEIKLGTNPLVADNPANINSSTKK